MRITFLPLGLHWIRLVVGSILVCALPFWRILLFEDRALLYRDIARHFLPGKVYWARSVLQDGSIPLWNYSSSAGMPFWAENVNSPLHPLNVLFLLFPLEKSPLAMNWFIFLHYPVLLLGAYFLLRVFLWGRKEAFLFAAALALSGTYLSAHNLCHSFFSFVSIPWFFGLWISYLKKNQKHYLFLSAMAIAWPIYAGDPQFSYFMVLGSLATYFTQKTKLSFFPSIFLLGILSLLFSGAQLFPLLEMIGLSHRMGNQLSNSELLYFSFHPVRLVETFFPQFFGNHDGAFSFWGQTYVNFPFPSPFIFSTFPGSLTLIFGIAAMVSAFPKRLSEIISRPSLLFFSFSIFLLLSFGTFSIFPLYEFSLNWVPLFSSFRYPERLLFWVFFLFWALAAWQFQKIKWNLDNFNEPRNVKIFQIGLIGILLAYIFLALILVSLQWAPNISESTLFSGFLFLLTGFNIFFWMKNRKLFFLFVPILFLEGFFIQGNLCWDSSIHVTDFRRYPAIQEVLLDLDARKEELAQGQARRYSSLEVRPLKLPSEALTHTNLSNFSTFEAASPNIPSFYGFDEVGAYYALAPKRFEKFLVTVIGEQQDKSRASHFFDLTGTYYRVHRNMEEKLVLEKRTTAVPYLFQPRKISGKESFDKALENILYFSPQIEALVYPLQGQFLQPERSAIRNLERTGRSMTADVFSAHPNPWIIWNEGWHSSWTARANGILTEVKEANGFSMAVQLPKTEVLGIDGLYHWKLEFRFDSFWIRLGIISTSLFFVLFGLSLSPLPAAMIRAISRKSIP